jgi:exopolyphosphatase/guanosine-5'-triphosphate,3'-diphosphate pyrophosphatase
MKIAAIDVGSNSIKLVVVDAAASDSFAVLAREKDSVRLGHDTLMRGRLSPEATAHAVECIKRFRAIAEARGAERILGVATASVREAKNAPVFIKEVARKAGVELEVLSPIEEARLIGVAVVQGCGHSANSLLNIDIGGGSAEISLMRDGVPEQLLSVKLGAVGLTEKFLANDPPKNKEIKALKQEIQAALERPARELKALRWQRTTGTSGTILAIGNALRLRALSQGRQAKARNRQAMKSKLEN